MECRRCPGPPCLKEVEHPLPWMALLLSAFILGLILVGCQPAPPPAERLEKALARLVQDSPADAYRLAAVRQKDPGFSLEVGDLAGGPNGALAITSVTTSGHAHVTVDVLKVLSNRDTLEPVIAHEIFHAYDALILTGPAVYIAQANTEAEAAWWDRTVEQRAIKVEDETRVYLLRNYGGKYAGMAPSRIVANARHGR